VLEAWYAAFVPKGAPPAIVDGSVIVGRKDVVLLLAGRRNLRHPRGSGPPIDHFVMVITSRTQGQR
jgi:hypothetical protein